VARAGTLAGALAGALALSLVLAACGVMPGASLEARDSDAAFELVIRIGSSAYPANAPMEVATSLTYLGPEAEIQIAHSGMGAVGVALEQLDGPFDPGGSMTADCARSHLGRGVPRVVAYQKSGAWEGDAPNAAQLQAWMNDPVLRLPPGTYRFTAYGTFSEGDCGGTAHDLEASVEVVVGP
jgi:hypothetical protein